MPALEDVDELLRAHSKLLPGGPGAPPIENGVRVGNSIIRAGITLISAGLQTEIEDTFRASLPLMFDHFTPDEIDRYWKDCDRWGNPSPPNIKRLFFRLGFPDVLDGLSWQKCANATVRDNLDEINQIRNRIAHGQPMALNGVPLRLTKPRVQRLRNFAGIFIERFRPFVLVQFE